MKEQINLKSQEGKATTIRKTFSRETSVWTTIFANPAIVLALLTGVSDFSRWNSTVTSIKGEIRQGETIELKSILDEKRTFKLKIKEFVPEKRLAWGDSQGSRVYMIDQANGGGILFRCRKRLAVHFSLCLPDTSPPFTSC